MVRVQLLHQALGRVLFSSCILLSAFATHEMFKMHSVKRFEKRNVAVLLSPIRLALVRRLCDVCFLHFVRNQSFSFVDIETCTCMCSLAPLHDDLPVIWEFVQRFRFYCCDDVCALEWHLRGMILFTFEHTHTLISL